VFAVARIDATTGVIIDFLESIGLQVRCEQIETSTVLPGVTVEGGVLVVDPDRLSSPGDLLHEAGHLAMLSAAGRAAATADFGPDGGYEMAAIAWSWAAMRTLGLDPRIVFHEQGYQGGSGALIENFSTGHFVGVALLEWQGLTVRGKRAAQLGVEPFPAMLRWLAD
jgi:hypothetical protein